MPKTEENYDIVIRRDGQWLHEGRVIARPNMVRLFSSVLTRDSAGDYWLETPAERGRITVEDLPFMAVAMTVGGAGDQQTLTFRLQTGEEVAAGRDHPLSLAEINGLPQPMLHVRGATDPAGGLYARIARAVYYDLVNLAVTRDGRTGIVSGGVFFPLGADA